MAVSWPEAFVFKTREDDVLFAVQYEGTERARTKKARRGELKNLTGIDSPYEAPEEAEIRIDTVSLSVERGADFIIRWLIDAGVTGVVG
ncbi:MAG: adenylyl-sulfate kinase [Betaproteobacteria bacterium]|nr:adenylyl-sulfate kinase [Betaproteobacteria bacterium]